MARPKKAGVDFFPHDVNATGKKTVYTLESMFGNDGYAFWFKLLETLGAQEGLYFDCSRPADWLFLVAKMKVTSEIAEKILETLAQLEAIDPELWESRIIWVQNFADRLDSVYQKRETSAPSKPSFRHEKPSSRYENQSKSDVSVTEIPQRERETKGTRGIKETTIEPHVEKDKGFESFWSIYPRKVGKKAAEMAWKKIRPNDELLERILTAISTAKKTEQWVKENGRYIPNPATWLNQGRWDDEITEVKTDIQNRSNYKQDYNMAAGQTRKAGSAAPGFKLAGEPDDEYEQERPVLSDLHMAE